MAASRRDIQGWFMDGVSQGATHMIVACDTFDHSDYPVYVAAPDDPREAAERINEKEMTRVMEVYALHLDMQGQLDEDRVGHYDAPPAAPAPPSSLEPHPTANTRWGGSTPEAAIAELEKRLASARQVNNELRAYLLAALLSNRTDARAILTRALAETEPEVRRPKRARRQTRRLLLQAARILEVRP